MRSHTESMGPSVPRIDLPHAYLEPDGMAPRRGGAVGLEPFRLNHCFLMGFRDWAVSAA